ncbi:helix-turn-helix domain-containing protein [Avibacterium sp. 21-599]|uniref:helix-turn-helix domain-containing protein n=1 Tax=Avibacterium sp. 21-599 TaxID=2911528 RepID=UPI003FA3464E
MNTYKPLTLCECEKIMVFHALGKTITQIAQRLQRHKSTISRELKRCQGEYAALSAQEHYQQRVECKPKQKLADPKLC